MKLNTKWAAIAGAVLLSGAVLTGVAFAGTTQRAARPNMVDKLVEEGKLTQAEGDVLKQLNQLRMNHLEALKNESAAVIDGAVKAGKITQQQADRLGKFGQMHFFHGKPGGRHLQFKNLTQEELKAKLDALVSEGRMSREKADKILEHHKQMQAKPNNQ